TTKTSGEPGPRANTTLAASAIALTAFAPPARLLVLFGGLALLAGQALVHRLEQPLHGEGLADVIDDAEVLGVGLVPAALVGGDHDDRRGVRLVAEVLQDGVAAHARHHHVQDHQVRAVLVDQALALLAVAGLEDAVALALEHQAQAVAQFD